MRVAPSDAAHALFGLLAGLAPPHLCAAMLLAFLLYQAVDAYRGETPEELKGDVAELSAGLALAAAVRALLSLPGV